MKAKAEALEATSATAGFWNDQSKAQAVLAEITELKNVYSFWDKIEKDIAGEKEKVDLLLQWEKELGNEEPDKIHELLLEIDKKASELESALDHHEIQAFLSGPHDHLAS